MKILLDENITRRLKSVLAGYGHDVIHVRDRLPAGESDTCVLGLAIDEHRALITLNGKDFIVMIPPTTQLKHYGLIWLRGFQVTRTTYECIMREIGSFLKKTDDNGQSIKNTYHLVKQDGDSYKIVQRFPKTTISGSWA